MSYGSIDVSSETHGTLKYDE